MQNSGSLNLDEPV